MRCPSLDLDTLIFALTPLSLAWWNIMCFFLSSQQVPILKVLIVVGCPPGFFCEHGECINDGTLMLPRNFKAIGIKEYIVFHSPQR